MITKTHAQTRSREAAERIRAEAQLQIDTYFTERGQNKKSATMAKILDQIDGAIKRACDGGETSVSLSCEKLFGTDEVTGSRNRTRTCDLLQKLGYELDYTYSSDWRNEQLTVMW